MQSRPEMYLYEYSVIRYVPRVEREEFVNVGLLLMCKQKKWLKSRIYLDEKKIEALCSTTDLESLRQQLESFEEITAGKSPFIRDMEVHERFRWASAVRSASICTSRPHPGKCFDLEATFERLFSELVE